MGHSCTTVRCASRNWSRTLPLAATFNRVTLDVLGQVLTQVLAVVVALVTVIRVVVLNRRETPLATTERLVRIIDSMPAGPSRSLLEESRDQMAIDWALQRQAPRFRWWRIGAWLAYSLGGIAWFVWILGFFVDPVHPWPWIFYFLGLFVVNVGQRVRFVQLRKSRGWVEQERRWRGLPRTVPEEEKKMTLKTARILLR